MTVRLGATIGSLALTLATGACTASVHDVGVDTPIAPKLDIRAFQRVLVAGFIVGGSVDVDVNLETVRLLRSQLRARSDLTVIDADLLPLADIAARRALEPEPDGSGGTVAATKPSCRDQISTAEDLEACDAIFADVSFWKKLGEEYQGPLIVTGTILFAPQARQGIETGVREAYDPFGRRQLLQTRGYSKQEGFVLNPRFIFIDGRTGAVLHSEWYREEVLYHDSQDTPALSSYFELIDRLLPSFLAALSTQKIRTTRVLLR